MTLAEVLQALDSRGVRTIVRGDRVAFDGPEAALTDDLLEALAELPRAALLDAIDPPSHPAFGRVHQAQLRAFLATMPTTNVPGRRYPRAPWERAEVRDDVAA